MRAVLSAVRHRLSEATVVISTDMHFPVTRAEASGEICRCCDRPARLAKVWAASEVSHGSTGLQGYLPRSVAS